tara:strand:- start:206 stop:583 length:378 start_codon:yes stop_codon:yes gene_type:complete
MIEIINEDTLVSELELTVRSEGVLRKRGIILVSDLTKVRYGELGRFSGIGKVSYHEIKDTLHLYGVRLAIRDDFQPTCSKCGDYPCKVEYQGPGVAKSPDDLEQIRKGYTPGWSFSPFYRYPGDL